MDELWTSLKAASTGEGVGCEGVRVGVSGDASVCLGVQS